MENSKRKQFKIHREKGRKRQAHTQREREIEGMKLQSMENLVCLRQVFIRLGEFLMKRKWWNSEALNSLTHKKITKIEMKREREMKRVSLRNQWATHTCTVWLWIFGRSILISREFHSLHSIFFTRNAAITLWIVCVCVCVRLLWNPGDAIEF